MNEANKITLWDALAELSHLENLHGKEKAMQLATAQITGGCLFIQAVAGKPKADEVVGALWRAQLGEQTVSIYDSEFERAPATDA